MSIRIDVFANLREREAQREANRLADIYERAGADAGGKLGDGLAKGIEQSSPKVQRAMNNLASATAAANATQAQHIKLLEAAKLQSNHLSAAGDKITAAKNREANAALRVMEAEHNLAQYKKRAVIDSEKLVIMEEKVAAAKRNETNASNAVTAAHLAEARTKQSIEAENQKLIASSNSIVTARNREANAHRNVSVALRDHSRETRKTNGAIGTLSNSLDGLGKTALPLLQGTGGAAFGKNAPPAIRGLAVTALGSIIAALVDTTKVAVTASQSLYLLPAAATAAGAAIGTLQLATAGFSDTIKDIRDPKKFAEGLASLSPNAQQAALSIRNLLPEFDKLKQATQDAFFTGFGEKTNQLSTTFLPGVQKLTTDIAKTFNESMTGIADTLMTPENQANISTVMANIGDSFRAAAPAAQSFSQAFIDIATAGSSFLPGLGNDIATMAQEFANFIREARESGQLKQWIQEGIDAVKALGTAIWNIGGAVYDVFGQDGQKNIQDFTATAKLTIGVLNDMTIAIKAVGEFFAGNTTYAKALNDAIGDVPEAFSVAGNAVINFANMVKDALLNGPVKAVNLLIRGLNSVNLFGPDIPQIPEIPNIPNMPAGGDWGPWTPSTGAGGNPVADANTRYSGPSGADSGFQRWVDPKTGITNVLVPGLGWVPENDPRAAGRAQSPYAGPFDVPAAADPNAKDWSAPADQWSLDSVPIGSFPGVPGPGGIPNMGGPQLGPVDPQAMWDAQSRQESAKFRVEETRQRYLELAHDNTTSETDLLKAKHDVSEAERDYISAEMKAAEVAKGKMKSLSSGMNDIGAALDADFGLSEGLPGLAKNLAAFLGNLATAPLRAQLQNTVNTAAAQGQPEGGFGLLGIMGAQNMMNGLSPLLGRPVAGGTGYTAQAGTGSMAMPDAGVMPSILKDTGSVPSGPQSRQAAALIQQMWGSQIRSPIGGSRDNNTAKGTHDAGLSIDIPIGPDQMALGDQIRDYLQTNAEALGLKYTIWRDEGRYPNGGTGKPGFNTPGHQNHIDAHFNGQGGTGGPLTAGGMPMTAGSQAAFSGASGATPVFVVNMPGGGGMSTPGMPVGSPASGQGSGFAPGPGAGGSGFDWDAVASAESSGNWQNADTGNNGHYGGLQFSPETWKAYGGQGMPQDATREQQIEIANRTAFTGFNGTPPQGLGAWEAITKGMVPGIDVNSLPTSMPGGGGGGPGMGMPQGVGFGFPRGGGNTVSPRGGMLDVSGQRTLDMGTGLTKAPGDVGFSTGTPPQGGNGIFAGPYGNGPTGASMPGPGDALGVPPFLPNIGPGPLQPGATPGGPAAPGGGTQIGSTVDSPGVAMGGTGGIGMTGGLMDAAMMAAGGLDLLAPGAGQAAQIGIKLANRAVEYGSQLAGIGVSGLMETFLPTGGSELANGGWIPRIAGGIAGASAAVPNIAGGKGGQAPPPLTPEQAQQQQGMSAPAGQGPNIDVQYNSYGQTEDQNGKHLSDQLQHSYAPPGMN